ncbi:MAG: hypothetical protein IKI61_00965, partial [Erysipelotrichaceae bacterium]|nr:hypothetical protein [Erysipelotrichaceae bacterium]
IIILFWTKENLKDTGNSKHYDSDFCESMIPFFLQVKITIYREIKKILQKKKKQQKTVDTLYCICYYRNYPKSWGASPMTKCPTVK